MDNLEEIAAKLRQFAQERDWDQFHSPKNLSMALSVEVSEIVEHFQWLTEQQSHNLPDEKLARVETELADILNMNLLAAASKKIDANERKYPVDKAKGNAKKYTEFDS